MKKFKEYKIKRKLSQWSHTQWLYICVKESASVICFKGIDPSMSEIKSLRFKISYSKE